MGALATNKDLWRVYIETGHKNRLVSMVTSGRSLTLFDDDFPIPDYVVIVNDMFMIYPELDKRICRICFWRRKLLDKMLIEKYTTSIHGLNYIRLK